MAVATAKGLLGAEALGAEPELARGMGCRSGAAGWNSGSQVLAVTKWWEGRTEAWGVTTRHPGQTQTMQLNSHSLFLTLCWR